MATTDERLAQLEAQVAHLVDRLATLERSAATAPGAMRATQPTSDGFAAQLQQRLALAAPSSEGAQGLVAYAGAVRAPEGELVWEFERTAADLLAVELEPIASVLAALGHAARLELLRLLLRGPHTSQQLQEALGLGSAGPLYYHLKELMAVGLVSQPTRNLYQVSAQRVVPFLAILTACLDVRGV